MSHCQLIVFHKRDVRRDLHSGATHWITSCCFLILLEMNSSVPLPPEIAHSLSSGCLHHWYHGLALWLGPQTGSHTIRNSRSFCVMVLKAFQWKLSFLNFRENQWSFGGYPISMEFWLEKKLRLLIQSSLALQDSFGSKTLELAETLMTKCFTKRKGLFKQNMLFSGKIFLIISFPEANKQTIQPEIPFCSSWHHFFHFMSWLSIKKRKQQCGRLGSRERS